MSCGFARPCPYRTTLHGARSRSPPAQSAPRGRATVARSPSDGARSDGARRGCNRAPFQGRPAAAALWIGSHAALSRRQACCHDAPLRASGANRSSQTFGRYAFLPIAGARLRLPPRRPIWQIRTYECFSSRTAQLVFGEATGSALVLPGDRSTATNARETQSGGRAGIGPRSDSTSITPDTPVGLIGEPAAILQV